MTTPLQSDGSSDGHRALEQNWLFFMSVGESDQRYRTPDLMPATWARRIWASQITHRYATGTLAEGMVILEVLSRHLHPMTYPGHRAGVTADSSSQPGGVSPVTKLSTKNLIFTAKSKGVRIIVTLECTECRSPAWSEKRSQGVSCYTTTKNGRNNPERLELMNFSELNRMTSHREIK